MEEEGEEATPPAAVLGKAEAELVAVLPPDQFAQLDVMRKITSIALSSRLGCALPVVHRAMVASLAANIRQMHGAASISSRSSSLFGYGLFRLRYFLYASSVACSY